MAAIIWMLYVLGSVGIGCVILYILYGVAVVESLSASQPNAFGALLSMLNPFGLAFWTWFPFMLLSIGLILIARKLKSR